MTIPDTIIDKLKNYEYEKNDYAGAINDIYALIHHAARLEEEIDDLKARAPREMEGDGSDLPVGSVVIDCEGGAWRRDRADGWSLAGESSENTPVLRPGFAPYTIVYTPEEES